MGLETNLWAVKGQQKFASKQNQKVEVEALFQNTYMVLEHTKI
jgi:hypothetical protein